MKLSLVVLLLMVVRIGFGQMQFPDLSPEQKIIQKIGYTNFVIRYERPAARGRKIMGELVPYEKLWRTGAGRCTTIQFDRPVKIGGRSIAAGIYALATIPSQNEWTILLNSDTSRIYYQASDYNENSEVARVMRKPKTSDRFYESFTIDLDVADNNTMIFLSWENTQISFPIETNTSEWVENRIQESVRANPNDPELLSSIAYYYEMNNKKIPEAYEYIKRAMALKEDRWYYRLTVDILVKMKDFKEAIRVAQQSISFLERSRPEEWEESVQEYKNNIRKISVMK